LPDGKFQYDAAWILYPVNAGIVSLDLPPVRYQLSGSDRRRFHLPLLQLDVKALPTYLPPTLPVGQLSVHSQIHSAASVGRQWQINIQSDGLIPYGVPEVDTQLAAISQHDIATVQLSHTQQSGYREHNNSSLYLAPLPRWLMPFGTDLNLSLRWFNPQTGRLQTASHSLPRYWQMPAWAWWMLLITGLIIAAFIILRSRGWIQSYFQRLTMRRQLQRASNAQQLRRILLSHSQHITLSQWASSKHHRKPVAHELNQICFASTQADDIQSLKYRLLKVA